MKLRHRTLSFFLALCMLLVLCGCAAGETGSEKSVEELNIVSLDVEISVGTAIVMVSSEDEIFGEDISKDDVEVYVLYFGDSEETRLEPDNLMRQSGKTLGMSFGVDRETVTVEIKIKSSGTLNGKEYVGATQKIIYTSGASEQDVLNGIEAIKKMLTKGTFSTVMSYGSSIFSACSSVYSILQVLGYAKTAQFSMVERTLNNVRVIEDSVDALDKKLDVVYGNLKTELDRINVTTKRTLRNTYAQQWAEFKTQYVETNSGLEQQINSFKNRFAANFCNYPADRTGTFSIYYDENGAPAMPLSEDEHPMVSVEGNPIDESRTVSVQIDGNTFAKSKALKVKAVDNEKFCDTFDAELRALLLTSSDVTEENLEKTVEDAMAMISTEVIMETLNEKGKNGTVADDLADSFVLFCGRLCDAAANPVEAYHYLITSNYNFQSEAERDITAFNNYILALAAEGRIYCDMAAMYGGVSGAKKSAIDEGASRVADFMETHSGLREEKEGTQYCYVTGSYVTANQHSASLYENITCHLSVMVFYTTGVYDSSEFRLEWNDKPVGVISTEELREIYATYRAMRESGVTAPTTFEDYFLSTLVLKSKNRPSFVNLNPMGIISGSKFDKRAFTLDGTTSLKAYSDVFSARTNEKAAVHAPCEYFETGKTYALGKEYASSDADKGYFTEHSAIYSDVMDMKTEQFYSDRQLLSGAMYIEASGTFIVDEMWEFAGVAELSNKDNWSDIHVGYSGDPTYDPQHPWGETKIWDYMINSNTHSANPIDYYLSATAAFWSIEHCE